MLDEAEWGEYKLGELFEIVSSKKRFDANKVTVLSYGGYPYIVRQGSSNGQKGYINEDPQYLNEGNTISFGQDTATMFYQDRPYFTGDKIKVLKPKYKEFNKDNAQFFLATMERAFSLFSWGASQFNVKVLEQQTIKLPTKDGEIDFAFMERFIAELEARHIAELEARHIAELEAYLTAAGLKDYTLTHEEQHALATFDTLDWVEFNLEKLFGKSTRGKRLKSADRVAGSLPFVTAGEAEEGVSAYIGNNVHVFSKNTFTIDMFGSAKYRNYDYGADDHVAVVHTENVPALAAVFLTTTAHKSAHNGQFSYSRNFYAKDADALHISVPTKDGEPDYAYMQTLISAIQKLVIKDVVRYSEEKLAATKAVTEQ